MRHLALQFVRNDAGEKTAVILPIDQFQGLMEDIENLAAVGTRRDEPSISHADLIAELKQDGLI